MMKEHQSKPGASFMFWGLCFGDLPTNVSGGRGARLKAGVDISA
jgi:hypothetical protein